MTLEDYSMYKIVLPSSFCHVQFLPARRYVDDIRRLFYVQNCVTVRTGPNKAYIILQLKFYHHSGSSNSESQFQVITLQVQVQVQVQVIGLRVQVQSKSSRNRTRVRLESKSRTRVLQLWLFVSFRQQYSITSVKALHLANEFDILLRKNSTFQQQIACKVQLCFIHIYTTGLTCSYVVVFFNF